MDNRSFEEKLRAQLHDAVGQLEAAPLPESAPRRARFRQMVGIAAVVLVVAVVAGTALTVLSDSGDPSSGIASAPEGGDDARGSGGTYPCSHKELDGECVAHGEYDGTEWWIGARMEGDDLCTSDVQEDRTGLSGSGMGCGSHDPDKIGFGVSTASQHPPVASGEVAAHVDRLLLERSEGPALELELYPAPEGFPLDVRFYNVFLPDDALELVAYDSKGDVAARQEIPGVGDFNLSRPEVVSPRTEIAVGEVEGNPWTFEAREELTNGDITPCADVTFGYQEEFGGGGSCNIGIPGKHPLGFAQSSFESGPPVIAVYGAVDARATEVLVELESGDSYEAEVFEAPSGFRNDVSYYVVWIPREGRPNPPGRIVALDATGNEIGREDLCGDIASSGGTCG